eukprot:31316-Pelagococcus_subviridis.AAC.21
MEWSSSIPTDARKRPVASNDNDVTARWWNPLISLKSSHVTLFHTQIVGSLPTCPVAMISRSGCIARHTMSSVCVVKNCCVCSALSYAIPVAPCVRRRTRRAKKVRIVSRLLPGCPFF